MDILFVQRTSDRPKKTTVKNDDSKQYFGMQTALSPAMLADQMSPVKSTVTSAWRSLG
ncbi:hypothetical protein ABH975_006882 [Bradyrhizobium ottawaense]